MQQVARNWMIRVLIGAVFVLSISHTPARATDPDPAPTPSQEKVLEKRNLKPGEIVQFVLNCKAIYYAINNAASNAKTAGGQVLDGNLVGGVATIAGFGISLTNFEPICYIVGVISMGLGWVACFLLLTIVDPVFSTRTEVDGKVTKEGSCNKIPKITQLRKNSETTPVPTTNSTNPADNATKSPASTNPADNATKSPSPSTT